jgi:hypothetical protein
MDQPGATGWWPADEHARLSLLERVLSENAPLRHAADLISKGVATALNVPIALVSLVGRERQHFLGNSGIDGDNADGTPLSHSFCKHVVDQRAKLIVDKAVDHPLVRDNPAIVELGVAAYAGEPIVVAGQTLGSMCAIDHVPRVWTDREISALRSFADAIEYLIETRLLTESARESSEAHDREGTARLAVYEALAGQAGEAESLNRRLQHALVPRVVAPAGLDVEVFYQPGSDRLMLGGDFVDTLEDEEEILHFVIGHVSGNGPEAAALAIGLRSSWHALQVVGTELAQTVTVLDRQACDAALYASVLIGSMTHGGRLSLVNAGHPDPIMVGTAVMELATDPGPMLGLGRTGSRWLRSDHDTPNQTFIAYTDGLIEGTIHRSGERFGVAGLLEVIAERGAEPAELCRAAAEANGEPLGYDVAILHIRPSDRPA